MICVFPSIYKRLVEWATIGFARQGYTQVFILKNTCCAGKYPSEVFMFWYLLIIFINSVFICAKTRIEHFFGE